MFELIIPKVKLGNENEADLPDRLSAKSKFPLEDRLRNTDLALARHLPSVGRIIKPSGNDAIILGAGPSINQQIETIKSLNMPIFCIDRMCSWVREHEIKPEYVVVADASSDVPGFVAQGPVSAKYLLATQCNPETFDRLEHASRYIYSPIDLDFEDDYLEQQWQKHNYPAPYIITGGPSVVHMAIALALGIGFRNLHIFGFDCHLEGGLYANDTKSEQEVTEVKIGDRIWKTTFPFVIFAERFIALIEGAQKHKMIDSVQIYGDSLAAYLFQKRIDWRNARVGKESSSEQRL